MDNCTICFEHISIPVFQEGQTEVSVENDCSRLKCGHAFHTKCLVQSLNAIRGCPMCRVEDNDFDYATRAKQRLHMEAYCDKIMLQVKHDVLTEHTKDYRAFTDELEYKRTVFKERVSEFKKKLREEMKIEQTINHISEVKRQAKRIFSREIKRRGGIFYTAMRKYTTGCNCEEKLLFGERSPWYFSFKNKRDFW